MEYADYVLRMEVHLPIGASKIDLSRSKSIGPGYVY